MAFKYAERKTTRAKKTPGKSFVAKGKKPRLGAGGRFKALTSALSEKKGIRSPEKLAAWIGAKVHGRKKMTKMSVAGRKKTK